MIPAQTRPLRGVPAASPPKLPTAQAASVTRPAFYLTLVFVFVVYARVPEIMDIALGAALHSARFIMGLTLLAILLFGGNLRAILSKIGLCMISFTAWLCICTPFSVWKGGSARMLKDYWLLALFSFIIIAASVQGLEQCRKLMYALGAATIAIEAFTVILGRLREGRMSLLGGTLGNANYLAMMLLMGVPFCLFVVRTRPGMSVLKFFCLLMLFCVPVTVAATGSRGGLVTLLFMFLLYFIPLPASQKVVTAVAALILAVIAIAWSTRSALDRYRTFFTNSGQVRLTESEQSALESMGLRRELLLSSLQLTMRHPLFGVGPGMFAVANANFVEETTGRSNWNAWHETHNTFTQVSCEDGLPGLFLYCLMLLFCFKAVYSAGRLAKRDPSQAIVGHMAFALRLALIAFAGTSTFASNAYAYYFPMLAALCVALERSCAELPLPQPPAGAPSAAGTPVAATISRPVRRATAGRMPY